MKNETIEVREIVKEKYGRAALRVHSGGSSCCGADAALGQSCDPITSNLYDAAQTGALPEEAVLASLGCGNPTALAGFVNDGDSAPVSPLAQTIAAPQVTVDNQAAEILFAGLTPGLAGLYQINFVVPPGLAAGSHSVAWRTKDSTGPIGAFFTK